MGHNDGDLRTEIAQRRPFHSLKAEVAVSILRTAALIERHFAQVVARTGVTVKQETAGLARRERTSPDRRQVFCYITERGLEMLETLDEEMRQADEMAVGN